MAKQDATVAVLWKQYSTTRRHDLRNRLVEHYAPLVQAQAARLSHKFPQSVRFDEICSAAYEGLMGAVESYDPTREAQFETFCQRRIVGAVMDWLRSLDNQSRTIRQFERRRRQVVEQLSNLLSRPPTQDEIAEAMEMTMDRYSELNRTSDVGQHVQLSSLTTRLEQNSGGEPWHRLWDVSDPRQEDPSSRLARSTLAEYITRGLSRDQRLVLLLYYYEGLTMSEIGQVLDLSESRVCQIHKEVLGQLRRARCGSLAAEEIAA